RAFGGVVIAPAVSSNFGAVVATRCGGRGGSIGISCRLLTAPLSTSSSRPFNPFLNSTMPLPIERPTSGSLRPKSSTPRMASTTSSIGPRVQPNSGCMGFPSHEESTSVSEGPDAIAWDRHPNSLATCSSIASPPRARQAESAAAAPTGPQAPQAPAALITSPAVFAPAAVRPVPGHRGGLVAANQHEVSPLGSQGGIALEGLEPQHPAGYPTAGHCIYSSKTRLNTSRKCT